ncbi:hypothetical protein GN956_G7239 [Arapaima gigas]
MDSDTSEESWESWKVLHFTSLEQQPAVGISCLYYFYCCQLLVLFLTTFREEETITCGSLLLKCKDI